MTSSSYCELILRLDGVEIFRQTVHGWEIPLESPASPRLPANRSVELTLRRGRATSLLRVRLESDELMRLPLSRESWTLQLGEILRDQYGIAELAIEEAPVDDPASWSVVLRLTLAVEADPNFRRLHEALVAELEEVHLDLARDVVSRTRQAPGETCDVRAFSAEDDLSHLRTACSRLERSLDRIGEQPSRALHRKRRLGRWRPGDTLSTAAVHRMLLDGDVQRDPTGNIITPRRVLLDRPDLSTDIEEHRHIRASLVRLADRTAALSRYCVRAIDLLEEDEGRWSEEALQQKVRPKIRQLESIQEAAGEIQTRYRRLVLRLPFLARAGTPRTPFGPTPIFLGRPAYREVYRALRDARRQSGGRVDAEPLRVRFRNLATLYEYWLFVKVVGLLRDMYGAPVGNRAFSLIDEVYRPELAPGQQFRFHLPRGDVLIATYEPDFPPVAAAGAERYRSAFTSGSLRPDVVLELIRAGSHRSTMLALDAKSGPRFRKAQERLQGVAQYLWCIHNPQNGHQPVRQLFLVHRDLEAPSTCNLTGYLEGRVSPPDARVLGAVSAQPGDVGRLREVIQRFLETFRARRWR